MRKIMTQLAEHTGNSCPFFPHTGISSQITTFNLYPDEAYVT